MRICPELCFYCKHLQDKHLSDSPIGRTDLVCDAYPDGIPEAVFKTGHLYAKPGDNGVQYEIKDGMETPSVYKISKKDEDENYKAEEEYYCELAIPDDEWEDYIKKRYGDEWEQHRERIVVME